MPWFSGMRPRVCRRTLTAWPRKSSSLKAKTFHSWKRRQLKSEVWLSQSWLCGALWNLTLEVTTFWRWYCKDHMSMTKSCKVTQMSLVYPPTCLGRQSICITFAVWTLPILTHTHIYMFRSRTNTPNSQSYTLSSPNRCKPFNLFQTNDLSNLFNPSPNSTISLNPPVLPN